MPPISNVTVNILPHSEYRLRSDMIDSNLSLSLFASPWLYSARSLDGIHDADSFMNTVNRQRHRLHPALASPTIKTWR